MSELCLASSSLSRRKLLEEAGIKFRVISHCSRESDDSCNVEARVLAVAKDKMKCVNLVGIQTDRPAFILTADTLVEIKGSGLIQGSGLILGKPKDLDDAKRMISKMRGKKLVVATGCYLEKRLWKGNTWQTEKQTAWTTTTICSYQIPEPMVDEYFRRVPEAINACGGCTVEGYGQQFLKTVTGSYSAILGLPMAELREQLNALDF